MTGALGQNYGPSMRNLAQMSNRQREAEIEILQKKLKVVLIKGVHRDI